jgi:polyphosphate glucokinase
MAETILLGLDVGGSSIKAGLVDTARGTLTTPLHSVRTPTPSTPEAVLQACARIDAELGGAGPVGLAFPSVVQGGIARTAANVDKSWIGFAGGAHLSQLIGRPVIFLNDADAAGVAEMSPGGAGKDTRGVVMLLTFGTGIGSALFVDGELVPNTEFGHLEFHGRDAELSASARVRTEERLDWPSWCARVNDYLGRLHALFWPDLFIFGGSISEDFDQFAQLLKNPAPIRRAAHGAQAGVIGAAFAAARQQRR